MQNLQNLKSNLDNIFDISTKPVMDVTDKLLVYVKEDNRHAIRLLRGSYTMLMNEKGKGTITRDIFNSEETRLRERTLNLISNLTEDDIKEQEQAQKTTTNIAVICKDEKDKAAMESLMSKFEFSYQVEVLKSYRSLENFDLLLFCNTSIRPVFNWENVEKLDRTSAKHLELMFDYLGKSQRPMLHYGEFLYLMPRFREKLYAVNSKFALQARIKEMLDFLALG